RQKPRLFSWHGLGLWLLLTGVVVVVLLFVLRWTRWRGSETYRNWWFRVAALAVLGSSVAVVVAFSAYSPGTADIPTFPFGYEKFLLTVVFVAGLAATTHPIASPIATAIAQDRENNQANVGAVDVH